MITNIQLLRFLAAFGVAVMHVGLINGDIFFPGVVVGIDVFFVISGFFMVTISWNKFGQPGEYKRFDDCAVLCRYTGLQRQCCFSVSVGRMDNHILADARCPTKSNIWNVTYPGLQNNLPSARTLDYEMLFYLIFGAAMKWSRPIAIGFVIGILLLQAGIGELSGLYADPTPSWGFAMYWLSPLPLEFVWGMIVGIIYARGTRLSGSVAIVGCVVSTAAVIYAGCSPAIQHREVVIGIPAAVLLMGAISLPQIPVDTRVGRITVLLGDASYSLYLIHWILFVCVRDLSFPLLLGFAVAAAIIVRLAIEAPILELLLRDRRPLVVTNTKALHHGVRWFRFLAIRDHLGTRKVEASHFREVRTFACESCDLARTRSRSSRSKKGKPPWRDSH